MQTTFTGKRISSMLGILPETESFFEDEVTNYTFPVKQTLRLKKVMGYEKHRLAKEVSTVADFGIYGLRYMLDNEWIRKEEIGAVMVVTLCPDYFVPHISNIIQAECELSTDVICMDIAQGCCGFLLGLFQSFMLLEHMQDKKVVLVNGDVLSHKVSKQDRNDFPLIGDATSIIVVENSETEEHIYFEMHNDGTRGDALKIPAGAFRMPSTQETAILADQGDGNLRALDHMHMDGTCVFNFVQMEVPPMFEHMMQETGNSIEDIDYFLFHQPNKFMLKKLAEKIGLPFEKIPMNLVENYGNTSGCSIPLVTIHNFREQLLRQKYKCCLSAFGSGLAWGGMILNIGNLSHCEMVVSDL